MRLQSVSRRAAYLDLTWVEMEGLDGAIGVGSDG